MSQNVINLLDGLAIIGIAMILLRHTVFSADFPFRCGTSVQLNFSPVFACTDLLISKTCRKSVMQPGGCLVSLKNISIIDEGSS